MDVSNFKYKRGLTPEEAALFATGLDGFSRLVDVKKQLDSDSEFFPTSSHEAEMVPLSRSDWQSFIDNYESTHEAYGEAKAITEALIDELWIAYSKIDDPDCDNLTHQDTCIEIFSEMRRAPDDEYSYSPIPEHTKITRRSLAVWFYHHDQEIAKKFDPSVKLMKSNDNKSIKQDLDKLQKENSELKKNIKNLEITSQEKPLGSKERNSLLILIGALCKEVGINPNDRGIATSLELMTQNIGAPLTDDTIRNILKQIENAISSRSK